MGPWPLGRWCCWMLEPWWACMARGGDACRLAAMDEANGDLATADQECKPGRCGGEGQKKGSRGIMTEFRGGTMGGKPAED